MDFKDVTEICYDYTINGLSNMAALANKPFRFVYTSGIMIERNQNASLPVFADYRLMRVCCSPHPLHYDQLTPTPHLGSRRKPYHILRSTAFSGYPSDSHQAGSDRWTKSPSCRRCHVEKYVPDVWGEGQRSCFGASGGDDRAVR